MTTKITFTHEGVELVVMGEYGRRDARYPAKFHVERIEQAGINVTGKYRRMRLIPTLEEMAREQIEES